MVVAPSFVSSSVYPVAQHVVPAVSGLVAGAGGMYLASNYNLVRKDKQNGPVSTLQQVERISRSVGTISWSLLFPAVISLWMYAIYANMQLKIEEAKNKAEEKQEVPQTNVVA